MNPSSPAATCSACSASAVSDGVCARCGFTSGEANRCPHCGAVARVEPRGLDAKLTWVCGVCGGPRMPGGLGGEAAVTPLREAKASQSAALRSRATFWVFAMMATFFTLVAVAAWPAALLVKLILLAFAVTPTALAVRARARAGKANADADEALERAWLAAAADVASHTTNGVTVAELAKRLKVDPVRAEALLTRLAVDDRTRIDVDDDAEVRYSIAPAESASPRLRVDASEDQFRALEEAEAEASRRLSGEEDAEAKAHAARVPFPRGPQR